MLILFVINIVMMFFIRNRTKNMDVAEITKALYEAERVQDKANNELEDAAKITDMIKDQITDVTLSVPLYIGHDSWAFIFGIKLFRPYSSIYHPSIIHLSLHPFIIIHPSPIIIHQTIIHLSLHPFTHPSIHCMHSPPDATEAG